MWYFDSSIGRLYIKKLHNGRYGFIFGADDTVWEASSSPKGEADNIYVHVTGCSKWDSSNAEAPTELSGWIQVPDPH